MSREYFTKMLNEKRLRRAAIRAIMAKIPEGGKIMTLNEFWKENPKAAIAFSGGVDSSLLLAVLKELHDEAPFPLLAMRTVPFSPPSSRRTLYALPRMWGRS